MGELQEILPLFEPNWTLSGREDGRISRVLQPFERWPSWIAMRWLCPLLLGAVGRPLPSIQTPKASFEVVREYPHETGCFTEGLSLNGSELLEVFESCGLTGKSYVRRYTLTTGATKQQARQGSFLSSEMR